MKEGGSSLNKTFEEYNLVVKGLKKQHETQAEQAREVLGKTACRLAAKRLLTRLCKCERSMALLGVC